MMFDEDVFKFSDQLANLKFTPIAASDEIKKIRESRILTEFSHKALDDLYNICTDYDEPDNNVRADKANYVCNKLGFKELGPGTNRIAFMKDGVVYKIALDRRGLIDNVSEYKRSIEKPGRLAKVYETNRTILTCEYCSLMDADQYQSQKELLRTILDDLSKSYIIDDLGLTPKNFCNWGYRPNDALVAIDYAYLYPYEKYPEVLRCSCGGIISPNSSYTGYKCSNNQCGIVYTPTELIQRFPMDFEDDETDELYKLYIKNINKDSIILNSNRSDEKANEEINDEIADIPNDVVECEREINKVNESLINLSNLPRTDKPFNNTLPLSEHLQSIVNQAKFTKPPAIINPEHDNMPELPRSASDQQVEEHELLDMLEQFGVIRAGDISRKSNPIYDDD